MDDVTETAAMRDPHAPRGAGKRARPLLFELAGLSMLISVALIAIIRFTTVALPTPWFAIPAIAAQILAIAGLASLRTLAARCSLTLARLGFIAACAAGVLMLIAAVWLATSQNGSEPGEPGAGFQLLILAYLLSIIGAFTGNAAAISRNQGWSNGLVLLLLAPPLLWIGLLLAAMAVGLQAALAFDLCTNGFAGLALVGTGLSLRARAT